MSMEMIEITNKENNTTKTLQKKHFRYLEKEKNRFYDTSTSEERTEFNYFCKFAGMRDRIVISEETYNDLRKQLGIEN